MLNDPRSVNSPRKAILASRVEAAMEAGVELGLKTPSAKQIIKKATNAIKKASPVHFEEKKHPRDPTGKFAKNATSSKSGSAGSNPNTDIRNKVIVDGDQGFKDVLIGLALGAMSEVMDVPENMSKIKIHQEDLRTVSSETLGTVAANGAFDPRTNEIGIDTSGSGRSLTAMHEIGHWLDYNLQQQHLTQDKKLMSAINNSSIIKLFNSFAKDPEATDELKKEIKYITTPTEMFARAYMQYIVTRSSNTVLKKELKILQENQRTQWEDKDFEPIGREFDRLFKTKKRK